VFDAAVIAASDRSWRGEREDESGRVLAGLLERIPMRLAALRVVPDTIRAIRGALRSLAGDPEVRLILTTGGTGVTPRDVTPEATAPLLERELPGMAQAMRWRSYRTTPFALISRARAGFRGDCLIVNMPGSPRAVAECFEILLPTLRQLFGRTAARRLPSGAGPDGGAGTSPWRERWP